MPKLPSVSGCAALQTPAQKIKPDSSKGVCLGSALGQTHLSSTSRSAAVQRFHAGGQTARRHQGLSQLRGGSAHGLFRGDILWHRHPCVCLSRPGRSKGPVASESPLLGFALEENRCNTSVFQADVPLRLHALGSGFHTGGWDAGLFSKATSGPKIAIISLGTVRWLIMTHLQESKCQFHRFGVGNKPQAL